MLQKVYSRRKLLNVWVNDCDIYSIHYLLKSLKIFMRRFLKFSICNLEIYHGNCSERIALQLVHSIETARIATAFRVFIPESNRSTYSTYPSTGE